MNTDYEKHKEAYIRRAKEWRKKNPERDALLQKRKKARRRERVFQHYGMSCICCGEKAMVFLTIDHIDGNGTKHRSTLKSRDLYAWLVREQFPPGFQTLCHNCNWGKWRGYCPDNHS